MTGANVITRILKSENRKDSVWCYIRETHITEYKDGREPRNKERRKPLRS